MKKLLTILTVAILGFTSCEKEQPQKINNPTEQGTEIRLMCSPPQGATAFEGTISYVDMNGQQHWSESFTKGEIINVDYTQPISIDAKCGMIMYGQGGTIFSTSTTSYQLYVNNIIEDTKTVDNYSWDKN